ncbi:MAG: hypothetical protein OXP69_20640 [Spirochaetaceae bacterium]|nr:hypothetical protein [Spirochaetaceae bacterium]
MRDKSDYQWRAAIVREQRISATEASRSFSKLLDRIELQGGRFVVHRRGNDVCVMAPPPVAPRRASECIALLRNRSGVLLDGGFGGDLRDILAGEAVEEPPVWDS